MAKKTTKPTKKSAPKVKTYKPFQKTETSEAQPEVRETPIPEPVATPEAKTQKPVMAVNQMDNLFPQTEAPKNAEHKLQVSTPTTRLEGKPDVLNPEMEDKESELNEDAPEKQKSKKIYIVGIALSLVIILSIGIFLYIKSRDSQDTGAKNETSQEASPTPESTAQPEVVQMKREEISLQVLNGSGISGKAATTADTFKNLGYKVDKIGNTDSTQGNKLYVSDKVDEKSLDVLLADVKKELGVEEIAKKVSNLDSTAQIIIGE